MLPLHASSPAHEKMNRHGYGNVGESSPATPVSPVGIDYGRRVNTMGESGRGLYRIGTDKWEKCVLKCPVRVEMGEECEC